MRTTPRSLLRMAIGMLAAMAWAGTAPAFEHNGDFIPARLKMDCSDDASCRALAVQYYKYIGVLDANGNPNPNSFRGSFSAWRTHHGFGVSDPSAVEARASYYNRGDLAIGRDMHCRTYQTPLPNPTNQPLPVDHLTTMACYVSNYGDGVHTFSQSDVATAIAKAKAGLNDGHDPFATVVMELDWLEGLQGWGALEVKFIAYDVNGLPQPTVKLDVSKNDNNFQAVPGTCMVCHGGHGAQGQYAHVAAAANGTVLALEGKYLPFDPSQYRYGDGTRTVPDAGEQEAFRQLNAQIRALYAPWSRHTIRELIDGWYGWCGGVNNPNCTIDEASHPFVPSGACTGDRRAAGYFETCGWSTGTPPFAGRKPGFDISAFYRQVPGTYCRTCHIAAPEVFNVQSFAAWSSLNSLVDSQVRGVFAMPLAEATFNNYWNDPQAQKLLSQYLDDVDVLSATQQACVNKCGSVLRACLVEADDLDGHARAQARASCYRANYRCRSNCLSGH